MRTSYIELREAREEDNADSELHVGRHTRAPQPQCLLHRGVGGSATLPLSRTERKLRRTWKMRRTFGEGHSSVRLGARPVMEREWSLQPPPEAPRFCRCFRASATTLIFFGTRVYAMPFADLPAIMTAISAMLLVVFYWQIVGTTREHLGTTGTWVSIPRSPQFAVLSGNATETIQWLRWERYERWMYTWEHAPIVRLCNANSHVVSMLRLYLAVGATPDSPTSIPMSHIQYNCTRFQVRIAADNCDAASLFIGVNSSAPLGEAMPWSLKASYDPSNDCNGGLGAASFYVTVSLLGFLTIFFAISLCVGVYRYCRRSPVREYELVATTDMVEIREY